MTAQAIMEILSGLANHKHYYKHAVSEELCDCIVKQLLFLLPQIKNAEDRMLFIADAAFKVSTLRYLSLEWTGYCLLSASEQNFPIWHKILVAMSFARLGQLNENAPPAMRTFIKEVSEAYCDSKYNEIRVKYPLDGLQIALAAAIQFK